MPEGACAPQQGLFNAEWLTPGGCDSQHSRQSMQRGGLQMLAGLAYPHGVAAPHNEAAKCRVENIQQLLPSKWQAHLRTKKP
jgi:hypothetical protein